MFLNDLNLINLSKFTVLQTITHLYKSGISVGQSKYHKKNVIFQRKSWNTTILSMICFFIEGE